MKNELLTLKLTFVHFFPPPSLSHLTSPSPGFPSRISTPSGEFVRKKTFRYLWFIRKTTTTKTQVQSTLNRESARIEYVKKIIRAVDVANSLWFHFFMLCKKNGCARICISNKPCTTNASPVSVNIVCCNILNRTFYMDC